MPRSNWKGFISFGLVNIPVVLYNAQDPSGNVSFRQINSKTGSRIKYLRVDSETGREVPWEQIAKGYEVDKDTILPVGEDELKRVAGENARTIAIEEFVDKDSINFINIENTYYLVPDKKGDKGYVILRDALKSTKKIGIAKVIISTKEYLAAVSVYENALVLYLLHYDEEMRQLSEFNIPSEDMKKYHVTAKEVEVAKKLIQSMAGKWKPEKYKDEYKVAVEKWANAKIKHLPATKMTQRAAHSNERGIDFVSLLKKSLESSKSGKSSSRKPATHLAGKKHSNRKVVATKH